MPTRRSRAHRRSRRHARRDERRLQRRSRRRRRQDPVSRLPSEVRLRIIRYVLGAEEPTLEMGMLERERPCINHKVPRPSVSDLKYNNASMPLKQGISSYSPTHCVYGPPMPQSEAHGRKVCTCSYTKRPRRTKHNHKTALFYVNRKISGEAMEYFYSKAIYHIRFSSDLFDLAVSMRSFGTSHFVRKVRLCLANISHSAFQNLRILLEYISPSALHLAFPNLQHIVFDFTPRRFFDVLGTTVRHQRFADRDQFSTLMEIKNQIERQLCAFPQCPQVQVEGLYSSQVSAWMEQGFMHGSWPTIDVERILSETEGIDPATEARVSEYALDTFKRKLGRTSGTPRRSTVADREHRMTSHAGFPYFWTFRRNRTSTELR